MTTQREMDDLAAIILRNTPPASSRIAWEDAMIQESKNTAGPDFVAALGYRRTDLVAVVAIIIRDRAAAAKWASMTADEKRQDGLDAIARRRAFVLAEASDHPSDFADDASRRKSMAADRRRYDELAESC